MSYSRCRYYLCSTSSFDTHTRKAKDPVKGESQACMIIVKKVKTMESESGWSCGGKVVETAKVIPSQAGTSISSVHKERLIIFGWQGVSMLLLKIESCLRHLIKSASGGVMVRRSKNSY